jgi:ATP-dependent helicase/nuclease subunit A
LLPSRPEGAGTTRAPLAGGDDAGLHRGRLIHRLLETLPTVPPAARASAAAAWLRRHGGVLAAAERREIARKVVALLDDPALAGLFAEGSLAEVPFSGSVGGRPMSGRIDRLVVTPDAVVALDYKTDRLPPASPARVPAVYLRQIAAYRDALAAIYPDRPIRCLLLWTETLSVMPLDAALLDPLTARMVGEA